MMDDKVFERWDEFLTEQRFKGDKDFKTIVTLAARNKSPSNIIPKKDAEVRSGSNDTYWVESWIRVTAEEVEKYEKSTADKNNNK